MLTNSSSPFPIVGQALRLPPSSDQTQQRQARRLPYNRGLQALFKCLLILAPVVAVSSRGLAADDLAQRVLIVYNEEVAGSKSLADYYAQKRGVPTNQVCGIRIRDAEAITRTEFNDRMRDPILKFLRRNGLLTQDPRMRIDPVRGEVPTLVTTANQIYYMVLMYGVPLRIEPDPAAKEKAQKPGVQSEMDRDEASVDSELALLPTDGYPVMGAQRNPFFGSTLPRFEPPLNLRMMLVGRLDGPDPGVVRRMIDDALTAERYGLQGRAYFDARGTTNPGYVEGDNWIRASYRLFRDAGYECDLDEIEPTFDEEYPMTDPAVYAGWYTGTVNGPFLRKDFRFKPGGLAYHLHSFSAFSIRTREGQWVGPLLAKGAAASLGNVYEPYLTASPHIDMFFKRLLDGGLFIEAGYCSQITLSWQTTFVGDPLYRPFALPLNDQIARLEADKSPDLQWAYLRQVNLLAARGEFVEAEKLCRSKALALASGALFEKLGDLLRSAGQMPGAIKAYQDAFLGERDTYRRARITMKLAEVYEANRQPSFALTAYQGLSGVSTNTARGRMIRDKISALKAELLKRN